MDAYIVRRYWQKNSEAYGTFEYNIYSFPSAALRTSFGTPSLSHFANSSNNLSPPDDEPSGYFYEVR
jgi:hypothetical protein